MKGKWIGSLALLTILPISGYCQSGQEELQDTLVRKTMAARKTALAWHIDSRAVVNVSISYASGRYKGLREEIAQTNCLGLALNKKGLLLLGQECADATKGPSKNFHISISLPYKSRTVTYEAQDFFGKELKRNGDYILYQMKPYIEYHTEAQAKQGIVNPRVLAVPVEEIFKHITVPAFLGLTQEDDTFILDEFGRIFHGKTPDEKLASWLKEQMTPEDFAVLQAK